ncbi:MAG: hypothetical protein LBH59_09405 [Planctomycetaceae bacterium]|nr:hypothetical protein [Planctomycetaceae bacterium]
METAKYAKAIPKPVWAVGFALEQTLRDATLAVFSFADFKTASAYFEILNKTNCAGSCAILFVG